MRILNREGFDMKWGLRWRSDFRTQVNSFDLVVRRNCDCDWQDHRSPLLYVRHHEQMTPTWHQGGSDQQ